MICKSSFHVIGVGSGWVEFPLIGVGSDQVNAR
jgi:hypothetical protein